MKNTIISASQRLQLIGLITVGQRLERQLRDVEAAACEITGEVPNDGGHTGDALYGRGDIDPVAVVDGLLSRLNLIAVAPSTDD